jgi:hypothetical protein
MEGLAFAAMTSGASRMLSRSWSSIESWQAPLASGECADVLAFLFLT